MVESRDCGIWYRPSAKWCRNEDYTTLQEPGVEVFHNGLERRHLRKEGSVEFLQSLLKVGWLDLGAWVGLDLGPDSGLDEEKILSTKGGNVNIPCRDAF